ncbi:hypothetical protein KAW50_05285 [candidate division WOR-3 bacterium]|nr:hypothetical protein [candidate division WOR-3 bacterium]
MRKCFVYIICGILVGANVNGSSVRIAGMGGVHIAIEDIESEMLENPAEWLRFTKPAILFDAIRGYGAWNWGFWSAENLRNYNLIPIGEYDYERKIRGLCLYPIKRSGVLGCGYVEGLNASASWHLYEWEKELERHAWYSQDFFRWVLLSGAIKLKSINIGVMSRIYTNSSYTKKYMYMDSDTSYSWSHTYPVPRSKHTFGLATDVFKNTHITTTVDFESHKSQYNTSVSTTFKIRVRSKVLKWLNIGGIIQYEIGKSKWNPEYLFRSFHKLNLPLGIAVCPDSQTIIGVDFHWPKVVVGCERLIGKLALRCGLEIYPEAVNRWIEPGVGIGYHLTDKLHFDFVTEPINWYLHGFTVQYKF